MRLQTLLAGSSAALAVPLLVHHRDFSDLLGGPVPTTTLFWAGPPLTTSSRPRFPATTAHLVHEAPTLTLAAPTPASLSPLPPPPSPVTTDLASTSAVQLPVSAPSSVLPAPLPTSPEEATQWKVIGIGIITVGLIATVILCIIFFDSWWNFICDLLCGKNRRRSKGEENMVPDWETRNWEFKLANEDGHRYPTMTSLTDITDNRKLDPTLSGFDPQYLDPLSRWPSTR